MTSPFLVTGGTGTLGKHVVRRLRDAGSEVRVLSRRTRSDENGVEFTTGDLKTGDGLGAALDGVGVVVHCATGNTGDVGATKNLVRAASAAGRPPHMVYISIVGIDRFPHSYYKVKLTCEQVLADSGLPWTTLRATQFHDLILRAAQALGKLPVVPVPAGFLVQPVDADEVAARLVDLALGDPAGRVPDIGGPQVLSLAEALRVYLRFRHGRRPVVPIWLPGIGAFRAGALLVGGRAAAGQPAAPGQGTAGQPAAEGQGTAGQPAAEGQGTAAQPAGGQRTWEEFLADRLS